jgi:hypothetical protein
LFLSGIENALDSFPVRSTQVFEELGHNVGSTYDGEGVEGAARDAGNEEGVV